MKKFNFTKLIIFVMTSALLIGTALCVTAMADEADTKGEFGGISVSYSDRVYIRVQVNATEEEIANGDVVVSYTLNGETKNATFYKAVDENTVWVITDGIAAYDLAVEVAFNSYVGDTQIEAGRTYSVAQFLYKMLYTNDALTQEYRNLYNALLAYGEAAQIALNKNTEKLVTDSTIVFTDNADIKLNGGKYAFAPSAELEITPVWNGTIDPNFELVGWNIIENGTENAVGLTFTVNGTTEVISPVFAEIDNSAFILQNGGFENGLEGWVLVGNIGNVSADSSYWTNENDGNGYLFDKDGEYMFSAYAPGAYESAVGTLTSSTFTVGGSGFVTFKLGAAKDGNYVYVDVVDADTKEILARYYNGLWADTTEGLKSGCSLVAYKADLSEFKGRDVFFRISDNADSGYGLFFADSFVTYYESEPDGFNAATPVNYEVSGTIYDVFNGGFEMGDVQGWWNNGTPGHVTNADAFFSGVAYGKDGNFLYSGVEDFEAGNGLEGNRGVLTSSVFEIGGTGYISFMLGGGGNSLCYVQVIDSTTGEILARYRQQAMQDAVLVTYVADLSAYIGRSARIQVVDQAVNNWGCVSFDNVVTYYASKDELPSGLTAEDIKASINYSIENGSFETGNIDGWTMDITEAGTHNTLGWVLETEMDAGWYAKNDETKDGSFLFTFAQPGDINCENTKGTLTSSTFTLKQGAFVSFKFGAAGNASNHDVYIELCRADGTVIARFYNDAEGKVNTRMNAYYYQYTDTEVECFFRAVDNSTGDYGCLVLDDFKVNLESAPEGYIPAIQ